MGLLRDAGVVYKPVEQTDLGPGSKEFYLKVNVKGFNLTIPFSALIHHEQLDVTFSFTASKLILVFF